MDSRSAERSKVFLFVWSGREERALEIVRALFSECDVQVLSKRELREAGWKRQIASFFHLHALALVFFCEQMQDLQEPNLARGAAILHHCRETIFADATGAVKRFPSWDWILLAPVLLWSLLSDLVVFAFFAGYLPLLAERDRPLKARATNRDGFDVAYLFPFPFGVGRVGGAMSHVQGVIGGLRAAGARVEVYSGTDLDMPAGSSTYIPSIRKCFLFAESAQLSYNIRFMKRAAKVLLERRPYCFYQRHGRWVLAGVLLATKLRVPLILEYNGSEYWIAQHWYPARFLSLLRLCEQAAVKSASLIVVVSEALKQELLEQGISTERILVNPNAADSQKFRPGCGGTAQRLRLGVEPAHILIGFLGTFSYFHGVQVLQEAIASVLSRSMWRDRLRFLLIGDGALQPDMKRNLSVHIASGHVAFAGSVMHEEVPPYLDAADVLVSPHVPMPDGKEFFGSPTKIFEYMSMGKGIVASRLGQLAEVLEHDQSAWLIKPGDADELAEAITLLAGDENLRRRLGKAAREAAIERHSWEQNATRLLERLGSQAARANAGKTNLC